jgi:hypothetical protein
MFSTDMGADYPFSPSRGVTEITVTDFILTASHGARPAPHSTLISDRTTPFTNHFH